MPSHGGTDVSIDPGGDHMTEPSRLPPDPEGSAEDYRLSGRCNLAIPILRALVARGDGYELAQYNLGLCLLDTAKTAPDVQQAASLKHEAALLILNAANHDIPKSELSLVEMYLAGIGVPRDPVEAGKWSLIYRASGARVALAMPNISDDLQARLDSVLTDATWAQARLRANAWTPIPQKME
ncbi:MAG TPA: hypothetical protein VJ476_12895 [Rhizomicrobium sp.]|nr:hypothetical protein [Rhizomicrobium sp.]